MGHNIGQGAGGLTFVEIQRFCGICPKTFETDCRKERKGKERKGKERKGKERKGKERKGKAYLSSLNYRVF
jgi:hypothetical protein